VSYNMHGSERDGRHIWLCYATQFTVGDRSFTVEMGIPVPVGASAEEREQLLREADTGMSQLTQVVEQRVSQMLQHATPAPGAKVTPPVAAEPIQKVAPSPLPAAQPRRTSQVSQTAVPAATVPTPAPSTSPATSREAVTEEKEVKSPVTRPLVGSSLSRTAGSGEANMALPEFIETIRENLGLTPKQAMAMLKVKSLSGINLREALEHLQAMVAQGTTEADTHSSGQDNLNVSSRSVTVPKPAVQTPSAPASTTEYPASVPTHVLPTTPGEQSWQQAQPVQSLQARESHSSEQVDGSGSPKDDAMHYERSEDTSIMVREKPPFNRFDEEIGPDENEALDIEDGLEDLEGEQAASRELTASERLRAKMLLDRMKEMRGTRIVSPGRLKVLNTLTLQQISQEQLSELINGVWGVATAEKLKVEQAEHLIAWAKEDDFVSEVEMVLLLLLEEENYARGNR
jgi:hypothetical protein